MKNIKVCLVLLSCVTVMSCVTEANTRRLSIDYQKVTFAELSRSDYEIMGRVTGESTLVENLSSYEIIGDMEYGYLGEIGYSGNIEVNPLTKNVAVDVPDNPEDQARRNAIYKLIVEANKLNADTIIFVKTMIDQKIENNNKTYHVVVSGIAVKIK